MEQTSIAKKLYLALGCALLGAALALAFPGELSYEAIAAPVNALGQALRGLSLSGSGGNAAAWAITLVVSLLPLLPFLLLRRRRRAAADLLRHCTVNQFEVWRGGERMTSLPVLILILLVVLAYWISLPLLVIGLLFGCRYRFSGPDLDRNRVGEVANQVSDSVRDAVGQVREQFKKEFSRSRHRKGK